MSGYSDFFNNNSLPNLALYTAAGAVTAAVTGHAVVVGAAFGFMSEIFSQCTKNMLEKKIPDQTIRQGARFIGICSASTLSIAALASVNILRHPVSFATGFTFACGIVLADYAWKHIQGKK